MAGTRNIYAMDDETHLPDDLRLGDPRLDAEHGEFARLSQRLLVATAEQALAALDALEAHALNHFTAEDADLRRIGGANATCHLDEHAAVLKSLGEVREVLKRPQPPVDLHRRLALQLMDWLPEHVQAMDAGLAVVRTQERLGGAPVRIKAR